MTTEVCMSWDAVAAIGQVMGSIAVFITLVYLAIQTNHARRETRRALSQGRGEAIREINSMWMDERMATIWTKGSIALAAPTPPVLKALMEQTNWTREEAWSAGLVMRSFWGYALQIIPHVSELHPIERKEFDNTLQFHYGLHGPSRVFYETYVKNRSHADAVRYVESVLAE